MPKVPAEHLAERRQQILHAAMGLFAENGFHAVSMQQITAASGMSAGAVYHYFPTKMSLIQATGAQVQTTYAAILTNLPTDHVPTPTEVVETICQGTSDLHAGAVDVTRIGIFMWAEALRDPGARDAVRSVQHALRDSLRPFIDHWIATGLVPADSTTDEVASAIYGLILGFTLQLNILGDVAPNTYARAAMSL